MTTTQVARINSDTADALSRRAEAEASVYQHQVRRGRPGSEAFQETYDNAAEQAAEIGRHADAIRPSNVPDPEGTPFPMADRMGNYAESADIANQGGIGVFDSNSRVLEEGEGTPNARLNAAELQGVREGAAPSADQNVAGDFLPQGGEVTQEDQNAADAERVRANLSGAGDPSLEAARAASEASQPKSRGGRPKGSSTKKPAPKKSEGE